jgi:DNA-binding NarL/FixJ family response regulator
MAARGVTNRETGERLFLLPRTVAFHLHLSPSSPPSFRLRLHSFRAFRLFPKLQVTTRTQLARLMGDSTELRA